MAQGNSTNELPEELLELVVEELRNKYSGLRSSYDQARVKILTLLGGGLAVLSFLYVGGQLFIPKEVYGKIFYITGLALFLAGIIILFVSIRPSLWATPVEIKELKKLRKHYNTRYKLLEYLQEDYMEAIAVDRVLHSNKIKYLDTGTLSLFVGAIMLLVIKYFGG